MFEITAIQANQGDALLLSYGAADQLRHILIDGGMAESVDNVLAVLKAARKNGTLRLEVLVVTHYDLDHIEGIIALLQQKPDWLEIGDVWFNGKKHLQPVDVLGHAEGETLTQLIEEGNLPWNHAFGGACISSDWLDPIDLPGGMTAWILSPDEKRLQNLANEWVGPTPPADDEVEQAPDLLGKNDAWPIDTNANYPDENFRADSATPNGSSIAIMFEYDNQKALLTGDAFANVVADGLEKHWELPVNVNVLKVSHHGSKGNTNPRLLQSIDCSRFLISTSGAQHKHPDQALIAKIMRSCPGAEFIFNYAQPQTTGWQNAPADWPPHKLTFPVVGKPYVKVKLP
ncbi:beta-lactamase superfamily II metal-dependent hydrolase [Duganella sp. SG902]|uniref:ComEC/Rec2 family competence protein n=1 Tax=Duganella sp. SG902 TaxID=2587016 RepID=UPI00159DD55F|nr:MBL fold metallo-hydrolase [Duganella sp. SG902]NVM77478.1 beta-lactamase superfamily II metal-dependent hydrolase [Duganella sp. SG902]